MRLPISNCRMPIERQWQSVRSGKLETEVAINDSNNRQLGIGNRQCLL